MKNKTSATDIRAPWLDDPATEPAELKNTDAAAAAGSIAPENADTAITTYSITPETIASVDLFDLEALRLDQSFVQAAGAEKLLNTVPVRKPNKQDFNRVHPGAENGGHRWFRSLNVVCIEKHSRPIQSTPSDHSGAVVGFRRRP
jgi:hypothetical protein